MQHNNPEINLGNKPKIKLDNPEITGIYRGRTPYLTNVKSHDYKKEFGKYVGGRIFASSIPELSDIRAKDQSTSSKFFNAFAKTLITAGTTAADIFVVPTTGVISAIADRKISSVFNNDISILLNQIRTNSETIFPNYRTNEEMHSAFYVNMFKNPANFWFDEFMKNTGFTIGMLVGGAGMGHILRGVSGVSKYRALGKFSENLAKTTLSSADKTKMILSRYPGLNTPEKLASLAKSIKTRNAMVNVATMALSSTAEANVEALNYIEQMLAENPDLRREDLLSSGLFIWAGNLGVLMPSGYTQFKRVLTRNFKEALPLNKVIVNGVTKNITDLTASELRRGGIRQAKKGLTRQAFGNLAKNMAAEGLFEEMGQNVLEIAGEKMATLYKDDYSLKNILSAIGQGIEQTYTSEEGWHEGVLGMLTALVPFGGRGSGITQVFSDPKRIRGNTQAIIDILNDTEGFKGKFTELYNNANFQHNLENIADDSEENQYTQYIKNELGLANDVGTFSALGRVDILKDRYRAVLDLDDIGEVLDFLGIEKESIRDLNEIHEVINGIVDRISEYEDISDSVNTVFNGLKDKDIDYKHIIRNILLHRKISEKYATEKHSEIVNSINDFNISNIDLTSSIIADITRLYNAQSIEEVQEILSDIRDNEDYKAFNENELYFDLGINLSLLTEAVIDKLYYSNVYDSILTKEGRDQFKSSFIKSNLENTLEFRKQKVEDLKAKRDEIKENFEEDGRDTLDEIIESFENMKKAHSDKEYRAKVDEIIKDLKEFRDGIEDELKQEAKEAKDKQEAEDVEDFIDSYQVKDVEDLTKEDLLNFDKDTDNENISDKAKVKRKALQKIMRERYLSKYLNNEYLDNIKDSKDKEEIKNFFSEAKFIKELLEDDLEIVNSNKDLVSKFHTIYENLRNENKDIQTDEDIADSELTKTELDVLKISFKLALRKDKKGIDVLSLTMSPKKIIRLIDGIIAQLPDDAKVMIAKLLDLIDQDKIELYENDTKNPTQLNDYIDLLRNKFDEAYPDMREGKKEVKDESEDDGIIADPVSKITKEMLDEIGQSYPVNFNTANTFNYLAKGILEKINKNQPLTVEEGEIHNRLMNLKEGDVLRVKVNGSLFLPGISKTKSVFSELLSRTLNPNKDSFTIEDVKDFIGDIPFVFTNEKSENVGATLQTKSYQDSVLSKKDEYDKELEKANEEYKNAKTKKERKSILEKIDIAKGKLAVYEKIKREQNVTMQIRYRLFLKAINNNLSTIWENRDNPEELEKIFSKNIIELEVANVTDVQPFYDTKTNLVSDMIDGKKYNVDIGFVTIKEIKEGDNVKNEGNYSFLSYQASQIKKRIKEGKSKSIFYEKGIDERLLGGYKTGAMVIKQENGMPMIVFGKLSNLPKRTQQIVDKNVFSKIKALLDFQSVDHNKLDKIQNKDTKQLEYRDDVLKLLNPIENYFNTSDFIDLLKLFEKERVEKESKINTYTDLKNLIELKEKSKATINYKGFVDYKDDSKISTRYNVFAVKSPNEVEVIDGENVYKNELNVYIKAHQPSSDSTSVATVVKKITITKENEYIETIYGDDNNLTVEDFEQDLKEKVFNANVTIQGNRLTELFNKDEKQYSAVVDTIFKSLEAPYKIVKDEAGNIISNLNPEGKRPFTISVKFKEKRSSVEGRDSKQAIKQQKEDIKVDDSEIKQKDELENEKKETKNKKDPESIPSTEEQSEKQTTEKQDIDRDEFLKDDEFDDDFDDEDSFSNNLDYFFKDDILDKGIHIPTLVNITNRKLDGRAYFEFDKKINNIYKKIKGRDMRLVNEERAKELLGNLNDNVRGFWKNGHLYIIKERKNPDVLLHESLHPFIDILEKRNPEVYKNILNEAKGSYQEILGRIKEKYDEKSIDKELLVYAIQSEIMTLNESSNILKDFIEWMKEFIGKGITNIALFFGSTNYKYLNKNTTLRDIARLKYYTELLSEEYLRDQFLDSSERRLDDKEKAMMKSQLTSLYAKTAYNDTDTRLKPPNTLSDILFINKLVEYGKESLDKEELVSKSILELLSNKDYLEEIKNEYRKLFKFKGGDEVDIDNLVEDSTRGLDLNDQNKTGIHQRNSANLQTKLFLASLTKYELGPSKKQTLDIEDRIRIARKNGLPVGIDYNNFFHKLMIIGVNKSINSFESFFEDLENRRYKILEIDSMLTALEIIKHDSERSGNTRYYDDLRNALYTTFSKASNKLVVLNVESNRSTKMLDLNRTIGRANANELLARFIRYIRGIEIGLNQKNDLNRISAAEKSLSKFDEYNGNLKSFLNRHNNKGFLDIEDKITLLDTLENIIKILDLNDIVTRENFEMLLQGNNDSLQRTDIFNMFSEFIDDVFRKEAFARDNEVDIEGMQNALNKSALNFGGALYIYGNKLPKVMTESAERKKIYTFGDKSFVDKVVNHFHGNDSVARDEFLNGILNDKTLENSYLRNRIFKEDGKTDFDFVNHLDVKLFSGIRSYLGQSKDYKNINGYDKAFVDLIFANPKKYNQNINTILIPFSPYFDSGTNNYLEIPEIHIDYNEIAEWSADENKIVKSAIFNPEIIYQPERVTKTKEGKTEVVPEKTSEYFEAVYSSVQVEVERMKAAKSLVDRYNNGENVTLYNNEHGYFNSKNEFITIENGKYVGKAFQFHFLTGLNNLIDSKTGIVNESEITKEIVAQELQKLLHSNYKYIQSKNYDLKDYIDGHEIIYITKALLNRIIYTQGISEIFSGHMSNYSSIGDYYQRNKFIGTIGISGASKEDIKYIAYHDPLYNTQIEKEYREVLELGYRNNGFTDENVIKKKVDEAVEDYRNMVATDGQIFCTPEFYEKYQKNIGKDLSSQGKAAHSMKPLVFSRRSENDTSYSVGIKSSMFPITEIMGEKYSQLLDFMRKNEIDMVIPSSAIKMGLSTKTINLFENGTLNFTDAVNQLHGKNIETFNMRELMVQQELPESHMNHTNKTSSQVLPLMIANVQDDFVYSAPNGKEYTGKEIKEIHDKVFAGILKHERKKLGNALGATLDENGNIKNFDRNKLFNELRSELERSPRSVVNALKSDRIAKLPLYNERLKSIIDNYISKRIIYPQLPGSHNIAVSDALDDSLTARYEIINKKTRETIKKDVNKDEEFDPNTEEMALIIPIKMPRWDSALEDVSIEKIPIDSRRMIGYRIPYSGKSLSFIAEVVGFTPRSSGSTIIIGKDVIARTGFDFDIDTFYFIQRKLKRIVGKKIEETRINKETNKEFKILKRPITIESENSFFNPENKKNIDNMEINELYNSFIDLYEVILGSVNHAVESITPASNYKESVEIAKDINKSLIPTDNYLTHVSIETSTEYIKNVLYQKKLIAIVANTNTMLSMLASYGAKIKGMNWEWVDENGDIHKLENFNTIKSFNGEEIASVNVSINLNHAADAVKKLLPITFNENTAGYVLSMMRLGVSYADAMYIIGQQSIFEYNQYVQRSQVNNKALRPTQIQNAYNNNVAALIKAYRREFPALVQFKADIESKYGAIYQDDEGDLVDIDDLQRNKEDEQAAKNASRRTIINEIPSKIKYFSQNTKVFNELNMKLTNAVKTQDNIMRKIEDMLLYVRHRDEIKVYSDVNASIFFEDVKRKIINKGIDNKTYYQIKFKYTNLGDISWNIEKTDSRTGHDIDTIIVAKYVNSDDISLGRNVISFDDFRKAEPKTSLTQFLEENKGSILDEMNELDVLKSLIEYNKFQVHVLQNIIHFNSNIGSRMKSFITMFGMLKKKVNETNPQHIKETFFKSEMDGNIVFENDKGAQSNMISDSYTDEIAKIKYDSIETSNVLNKFNTIDQKNNLSILAYKFLGNFGYNISSNPSYEKKLKASVFMHHFKSNIPSDSIFNIDENEANRLLGFDDYGEIRNTAEYTDREWSNLPLSIQVQSLKKSLSENKNLTDKNSEIGATDRNYKLYDKATSLLLNLEVENDPYKKELKDGVTLIDLKLDTEDLDVINLLTDSFEEMLNSDIDRIQGVALDLIKYLYITTGFTFSRNQLCSVIDFTKLRELKVPDIEIVLSKVNDISNMVLNDDELLTSLTSFVLNNPKLFEYVPTETQKAKRANEASSERRLIKSLEEEEAAIEKLKAEGVDVSAREEMLLINKRRIVQRHFDSESVKEFAKIDSVEKAKGLENLGDLDDIKDIESLLIRKLVKNDNVDKSGLYAAPLGKYNEYSKYLYYLYYKNKLTRIGSKGNSYFYEINPNTKSLLPSNDDRMSLLEVQKGNQALREYITDMLISGLTEVITYSDSFDMIFSNDLNDLLKSRYEVLFGSSIVSRSRKMKFLNHLISHHLKDYLTFTNNIKNVTFDKTSKALTFEFEGTENKFTIMLESVTIDNIILNYNKDAVMSKEVAETEITETEETEELSDDEITVLSDEYVDERLDVLYEIIKRKHEIKREEQEKKKKDTKQEKETKKEPKKDAPAEENDNILNKDVNQSQRLEKEGYVNDSKDGIDLIAALKTIYNLSVQENDVGVVFISTNMSINDKNLNVIRRRSGRFLAGLASEDMQNKTKVANKLAIFFDFINKNEDISITSDAIEILKSAVTGYNETLSKIKQNKSLNFKGKEISLSKEITSSESVAVSNNIINEAQANALKDHNEKKC